MRQNTSQPDQARLSRTRRLMAPFFSILVTVATPTSRVLATWVPPHGCRSTPAISTRRTLRSRATTTTAHASELRPGFRRPDPVRQFDRPLGSDRVRPAPPRFSRPRGERETKTPRPSTRTAGEADCAALNSQTEKGSRRPRWRSTRRCSLRPTRSRAPLRLRARGLETRGLLRDRVHNEIRPKRRRRFRAESEAHELRSETTQARGTARHAR